MRLLDGLMSWVREKSSTNVLPKIRKQNQKSRGWFGRSLIIPFSLLHLRRMANSFTKVKTEHTIMKEFHEFLLQIEKIEDIQRIVPGRIYREQSGRAWFKINYSYPTISGLKYKMCKGSTGQELFIICNKGTDENVVAQIDKVITKIGN